MSDPRFSRPVRSRNLTAVRFFATARRRENRRWRQNRAGAPQRWGVVSQVREPMELLLPFVLHHLSIGASDVTLYFDEPDDPAADILETMDRVTVIRCDEAHWSRIAGKRPAYVNARQFRNVYHAYSNTSLDWVAHIDADEFLHAPGGFDDVFEAFGRCKAFWIRILPLERIWEHEVDESSLFSGIFRKPLAGGQGDVDAVYGPGSTHLYPAGMGGHEHGKPFCPSHRDLAPGVHAVSFYDPLFSGVRWRAPSMQLAGLTLLHFPALTMRHFALKQIIKAVQVLEGQSLRKDDRTKIAIAILDADDPMAGFREWFEKCYVVDAEVSGELSRRGLLDRTPFRVEDLLRQNPMAAGLSLTHKTLDDRIGREIEKRLSGLKRHRQPSPISQLS